MDEELDERLSNIETELDRIRNNTNVLSTINKEKSKPELKAACLRKLGQSAARKKVWLAADSEEWMTAEEFNERLPESKRSVQRAVKQLHERSLFYRNEEGKEYSYKRSENTTGIGLEDELDVEIDG